jgi:NAD(P)-dependent dehydrogenase (short-subunit alcohol dehydrogenase family)
MTKVLVLGAGGQIARRAVPMLADQDAELTLFLRDASKLADPPGHARVVPGDVLDREQLDLAVRGQDIVYANLAGDLDAQAARIVASMTTAGVQRLIFITALGIYDEVPGAFGEWNRRQIGSVLARTERRQTPSRRPDWTTPSCGPPGSPTPTKSPTRSPRKANPSKGPRSHARAWPPSSPTSPRPPACGHTRTWE